MKYVLTKASDDRFIEIVDYDLEQINTLALSTDIVIKQNFWFNDNEHNVEEYLRHKSSEFCKNIIQIPLEITIYDDYIE